MRLLIPATLFLAACGSTTDRDTVGNTCVASIDEVVFDDGTTDVYNRAVLWVELDDATSGELTLTGPDGEVAGSTQALDDDIFHFVADTPLSPNTAYELGIGADGCEIDTIGFTTSAVGDALADLSTLVGRTWRIALRNGTPPPMAKANQAVIDLINEDLLLTVTSVDGTNAEIISGSSTTADGPQDLCVPTTPLTLDLSANPYGTAELAAGYASLQGVAVPTYGGSVNGSFTADATALVGIQLTQVLDMATAAVILGEDPCELLVAVGGTCEPCPSGDGDCLTFQAWELTGVEDTAADAVVERPEATVAADSACQSGTGS